MDAEVAPEDGLIAGAGDGVGVGEEGLVALLEGKEEDVADDVEPDGLDGGEGDEAGGHLAPRGVLGDEDRGPADEEVGGGRPSYSWLESRRG